MADATKTAADSPLPKTWRDDPIASAIHDAYTLGNDLVELRSRATIAADGLKSDDAAPGAPLVEDSLWMVSQWRSVYSRIVAMHAKVFPASSTGGTLYEPPGKDLVPYLYPDAPDYSGVGLQSLDKALDKFALADATRRAINCLTILYVTPASSLVQENVARIQSRIVGEIQRPTPLAAGAGGAPSRAEIVAAIDTLTARIAGFLDAWDGYLRENFFSGGALPNDELELSAYEAGRAMAWLSWGVSVKTLPMMDASGPRSKPRSLAQDEMFAAWKAKFEVRNITHVQHMLTALGGALDEAWYRAHPGAARPSGAEALAPFNPELPSRSLHAIEEGLEYWRRTLAWIEDSQPALWDDDFVKDLRLALITQTTNWHSLATGRLDLTAYTAKSVTEKMMKDLMEDLEGAAAGEIVDSGKRQVQVLATSSVKALEGMLGTSKRVLIGGVIALVLVLIGAALFFGMHPGDGLSADPQAGELKSHISSLSALLTTVVGWFASNHLGTKTREAQQKIMADAGAMKDEAGAAAGTMKSLTSSAGDALQSAFIKGYQQLRIELAELDHSVSSAYPLIELIVGRAEGLKGKGAQGFLTEVIWSADEREEELRHVTLAAFGPMAAFARAKAKSDKGT